MSSVGIKIINQLNDNYAFILYNDIGDATIIDPAESLSIIEYVKKNNLNIKDILVTHHHKDHTNGVKGIIKNFPNVNIHSPDPRIENTRFVLNNNDEIETKTNSFRIISTPGHTLDHIIFYDKINKILFCGDTLFRLGCGRVFEGTLNQMFLSLQKINELDDNLIIYCGHEYTLTNLNFFESVLEKNLYSNIRKSIESDLKFTGKTVPFNLSEEKKYNLFLNQETDIGRYLKNRLNLDNFGLFKYLREKKDNF